MWIYFLFDNDLGTIYVTFDFVICIVFTLSKIWHCKKASKSALLHLGKKHTIFDEVDDFRDL